MGARSTYSEYGSDPRITIPVKHYAGELVGVRLWNPMHPDRSRRKTWIPGHGGNHLLGAHKLAALDEDEPVLWCEGESDYLAVTATGVPVVAVTGGAMAVPTDLSGVAGRRVVVAYDNDGTGRKGARKAAAELLSAGATVWLMDIGQKVQQGKADLRDWLVKGGATASDLRDLMEEVAAGRPLTVSRCEDEEKIAEERRRRRVRRSVDAEKALADWEEPPSFIHMGEELDLEDQAIVWAIEDLFELGTNVLLVAGYKAGKTVLALNMVKSLVDNEGFLGFQTDFPDDGRRVAWWNYELTQAQARRWVHDLGVEHPERISQLRLRGYSMPLQTDVVVDWAVEWLRLRRVRVWVLDPFSEAFDGDENDNSVVRVWLQNLDEIKRRAGVECVLLIAHGGHVEQEEGREHARGASKLEGWKDVGWYYTKHSDQGDLRFLRAFGRDVDVPNFAVQMNLSTRVLSRDESSIGLTRNEIVAQKKAKLIAGIVARHPGLQQDPALGITKGELRMKLGKGGNNEKDVWIALAERQRLIRTEPGKQRAIHHYPVEQASKFHITGALDD